jgi:hypothetical protein
LSKRRGPKPDPIVEFPQALFTSWDEPEAFHEALDLHMRRHADTNYRVHKAVVKAGDSFSAKTLSFWRRGLKTPQNIQSLALLSRIEHRYRLANGYFKSKIRNCGRAAFDHTLRNISPAERRRIVWHLPDDFARRSRAEQAEILNWVRTVIISGSTEYRRYQAAAMKHPYAVRLLNDGRTVGRSDGTIQGPEHLVLEMEALLRFKTAALTEVGYQRTGVWGAETAAQKVEHFGLMFGALASSPLGPVAGLGVPLVSLCLGVLVFPAVWDWYLRWRASRRGFYTAWEIDMLRVGQGFTRRETGWIRQNPSLGGQLLPIRDLISQAEIEAARGDWEGACERLHSYAGARVKEIQRIARIHRDPFEPILPILEAASPVGEYRKIADEILKWSPDKKRYPVAAAENSRSYLLIRLGLHLGLRQKNLRQLLFKRRGESPTSERSLADRKCGELRWSARDEAWEVFIPPVAFKNVNSSFFANRPFRLLLPDLAGLYLHIDEYLGRHRARLLKQAQDPGTFFVKTVKRTTVNASYDQNSFYEAWRLTVQRYGVYNPYTRRGAIAGLLPHGPHSVRDVLATHILKLTGSYEQASYAIQDTPEMVAKHYGRFLPQDKASLAAQILNKVWEAA